MQETSDIADYLVVGGGSAGCVVAARLSEDPSVRVTLLEAGPEDRDLWIHVPAGYARLFASGRYDWKFATEPEPELADRSVAWPRGRVLGGSGSVNGLVFLRGSPQDYDRWAQAGARGWSYEDVLPAFRRMEDWEGPAGETRGKGGPLPVGQVSRLSTGAAAFIASCQALGFPLHRDINDGPIEGVAPIQMNVRRGQRFSTARAYLRPARRRPNLQVLTGIRVQRVLIEDGRAVGVSARRDGDAGEEQRFEARREVVLCAGAVASPKLLLLSGHRQRRGAVGARHPRGGAPARRRTEPPGPPDRPPVLPHPARRHAERDHGEPLPLGQHRARLRAAAERAAGGRRDGSHALRTPHAGRGGGRGAVPVHQLQPFLHRLRPPAAPRGDDQFRAVPSGQPGRAAAAHPDAGGQAGHPGQLPGGAERPARHGGGGAARPAHRPRAALRGSRRGGNAAAAGREQRRSAAGPHPPRRHHRVPPLRHLPHGHRSRARWSTRSCASPACGGFAWRTRPSCRWCPRPTSSRRSS